MLKLKIDNREVSVPAGVSVLAAARMGGAEIPTMCYREGKPHFTSCMICMVKDNKSGKLFPSCSVKAIEGMEIITRDDEIVESRRTALELLLSEHVGDCEAPCQITCPAHMDIPLMNRLLAEGRFSEALEVVKQDIALPAVLGRICSAPCEGACRRKTVDSAVSICLLKRYAGDHDLAGDQPYAPTKAPSTGKKIVVIGAGPAGLAAAWYLQLRGHDCAVYDRREKPGGKLWREVEKGLLPEAVLDREVGIINESGVVFHQGVTVDKQVFARLKAGADAVFIAVGSEDTGVADWGVEMADKGVEADKKSYMTPATGVFAAGSAVRPSKMAIRTLGQGKEAAFSIHQFIEGKEVTGEPFVFNSRFGKLMEEEVAAYLTESVAGERIEPAEKAAGLTREQVMEEAARCLHCDCRAIGDCKLRDLSHEYQANQKHYWSVDRKRVEKHIQHDFVIYEPNKCIKCGICVHITEEHSERYGMSFIGRGFDVVIGVPFGEALDRGIEKVAAEVVAGCPTGALSAR